MTNIKEVATGIFLPYLNGCDLVNLKKSCFKNDDKINLKFVYFDYNYSEDCSALVSTNGHVMCAIPFTKIESLKQYDKHFLDFKKLSIKKGTQESYLLDFNNGYVSLSKAENYSKLNTEIEILKLWKFEFDFPEYKRTIPKIDETSEKGIKEITFNTKLMPDSAGRGIKFLFAENNLNPVLVKSNCSPEMIFVIMPMRM